MDIAGHYDFGKNVKVSNAEIEAKLRALVGPKGGVSVGSTYKGVPFVTIREVDATNELAVVHDCDNAGKDFGAKFIRAIEA